MSKGLFVFLNVAYFIFDYIIIPYLPNPLVFGFLPFQLFMYIALAPTVALLWGSYFTKFFNTQK